VPAQAVIAGDKYDPTNPALFEAAPFGPPQHFCDKINRWIIFIHSFFFSLKKKPSLFTIKKISPLNLIG
jgi:hypothetical protein